MTIAELVAVCPPPRQPIHAHGDWAAIEARLGPLPSDYKALIETYGSGSFCELHPLNPFDPRANLDLVRVSQIVLAGDRETRASFPEHLDGVPLHPAPGGLLPWALHGNGGFVYWRTEGPPERWPVVALASRELHGEEHATSATRFLARWLEGKQSPADFGDVDQPSFAPTELDEPKRIEVHLNPIAEERTQAAQRIAAHLGKAKDKGKHLSETSAQWHFLTAEGWKVTYTLHGVYGQLWIDVPPADERALEARIAAIPAALGWEIWNLVTTGPRDARVPVWPHIPRAPERDVPLAPEVKAKAPTTRASNAKPKPKTKAKSKAPTKGKATRANATTATTAKATRANRAATTAKATRATAKATRAATTARRAPKARR